MDESIVRIGDSEHRARSLDELRAWRREGRVQDGHYVYHPVLQRWLYAREVEELRGASPAAAPPPRGGDVLTKDRSCSTGCGALLAILVVLVLIAMVADSCTKSREQAAAARAAAEEAERRAKEASSRRDAALTALGSASALTPEETVQHCDAIVSADGVAADVLRRCATARTELAAAAVKSKNFALARNLSSRAESEGATPDELKEVRAAIEKHEAEERRKAEAERRREESRRKAALAKMTKKHDKLENTTWYQDATSPQFNNRNAFYLYFGEKHGQVWLRWRVQYFADDWLFIRSFTVYADGVPYEYPLVSFERDHGSGDIWEWYDTSPTSQDLAMIRAVIKSKEATVRFHGSQYRNDRQISAAQKRALQRVLDAYAAKGGRL